MQASQPGLNRDLSQRSVASEVNRVFQAWWCMAVIKALGRGRQEKHTEHSTGDGLSL